MSIQTVQYYFAYGSNMNQARMQGRDMRVKSVHAGWLDGFGLRFNKASRRASKLACANMVWARAERIQRLLYELESIAEIEKLDPHEGAPWRYSREVYRVHTAQGVKPAWIYVANPSVIDNNILPARWYLEHLLAGRDFLTPDYWDAINTADCQVDGIEWS